MAGALVNAHLVPSKTSKGCCELGSSELRDLQGLRFPLKPVLRSVNVVHTRGRKRRSGCIRSLAENGSANSSNGSAKSRMVPIEEALKGRSATFLSNRPEQPKPNGTVNGAAKGSRNGAATNKNSTKESTNGFASRSTTTPGLLDGVSIGKVNGSLSTQVVIPNVEVAKRVLLPPVDVGKYGEQSVRVLPSDEGFSWAREDYSATKRNIDVWSFVLTLRSRVWFLDAKWTYVGGFTEEKQKARRRTLAVWVREKILQLGPTFIKLGQLSSTRSDLFPAEIVEELAKLQDRVPAFSAEKAMAFIEKELGAPVDKLFADFELQPIAAASLGQVHRATLPNGERVVVKVQRPGLKKLFDIDLGNMKVIAQYFQNSESMGGPTRDWLGIYEECATILYQEIDYLNEGRNADRFKRDFRKQKWVKVPQVYWDYASQKVLTLEYIPGIKVNDVAVLDSGGFDKAKIASLAIEAYLIQILRTGFFHADPHPGNLAVDADGSLIYYDFGMMGEIKSFTRETLLEMFYAVYEKDAQKIIQALIALGALVPTGDMGSVRRSVQYFLDNLMDQKPDKEKTFSAIGEDLFAIAVDQPFRFPATFTFVLRAFSTLEGIGNTLDPDFSFAKIAAPYAQELLDSRKGQRSGTQYFVEELQRQANDARDATVAMPLRVQRVEKIMRQLEAGDLKLRVRSLEAERAARRQSVMQMATINTLFAVGLANIGVTLSTAQGITAVSSSSFVGAGVFLLLLANNVRRIRSLDKFEKMM